MRWKNTITIAAEPGGNTLDCLAKATQPLQAVAAPTLRGGGAHAGVTTKRNPGVAVDGDPARGRRQGGRPSGRSHHAGGGRPMRGGAQSAGLAADWTLSAARSCLRAALSGNCHALQWCLLASTPSWSTRTCSPGACATVGWPNSVPTPCRLPRQGSPTRAAIPGRPRPSSLPLRAWRRQHRPCGHAERGILRRA